mgnify:CR=1 FL=1|jgi:hypothetical protein
MITLEQYNDMPEYWDYQRKIEFNKEKCRKACENIQENFGELSSEADVDDMFEMMWHQIDTEDYEDPPKDWVPKNPDLRLHSESYTE